MPNRIIKESACTSETLAEISADAERLFWRLIVQADDYGCFDGRPQTVLGKCLTAFIGRVSLNEIGLWLDELEQAGLIRRYTVDDRPYIHISKWAKHQRPPRAAKPKWPLPPDDEEGPPADTRCQLTADDDSGGQLTANAPVSGIGIGNVSGNENGIDDDADTRARAREALPAPDTEPEPEGKAEALHLLQTDLAHWHGTERIRASLTDFAEEMSWPVVVLAMERTIEGSPTKAWTYCRRILNHWSERGVRCQADVAALDAAFEAQRQVAAGAGSGRAGPGRRRVPQGMAALAELYEQARADEEGQPP